MSYEINHTDRKIQGQGAEVHVQETHVTTDVVILDPDSDLAVQVPDHGSTAGHPNPLGEALRAGSPEEQFAAADKPAKKTSKSS